MSRRPSWIDELFKAIDEKDAERFASFIAADGTFLFGNAPAVAHEVQGVSEDGAHVWSRGVVTYVRQDGSSLSAPFCNYFQMGDGGVRHYQIYVDASKLYG